ncbi:ATP-dependent RNA helicase dbp7 [Xylographa opegraphella]|nr:ATP-dependent RNA helicase dbp7 [Xylographa opegraphella]
MAEDGMLMNFALGENTLNAPQIFKGGPWKARLSAKKRAQYRHQKNEGSGAPLYVADPSRDATAEAPFTEDRPSKRQRTTQSNDGWPNASNGKNVRHDVVSSLFSSNPTSKIQIEKEPKAEGIPTKPSNAPLIDGLDTFTSLGLSTTIAAHLLTKLNLKAPTAIQKAAISQLIKEDSDAFIQAETGSGKTLAYLLPIVQRIMELSKSKESITPGTSSGGGSNLIHKDRARYVHSDSSGQVHRDSGLFAIVLAPTRELCKQISIVLDNLLRCAHWIVAGTVIGGEKKKSEKARLRKGVNILVATPGRLADHLSNTEALDVSNVRWLVLDEGDRLMELGFEEEIRGIVSKLEDRSRVSRVRSMPGLPATRTTVLCSATMKMNVQRLGEISLKDAVHIKADLSSNTNDDKASEAQNAHFSAPAQLKQSYILVPPKQRLVTLAALLKRTFARKGSVMKAIVFLSCADSVDFHFAAFGRESALEVKTDGDDSSSAEESIPKPGTSTILPLPTVSSCPLLTNPANPLLTLHKLHGSLPQQTRTATLSAFTRSSHPCILLCTDVASRGLDLPNIDLVIEYDPPFSADDHLHRVGRTARAGRDGRAVIFLMPGPEEGYVEILKQGYLDGVGSGVVGSKAEDTLKKGFGSEGTRPVNGAKSYSKEWEDKATAWQLDAERWVLEDARAGEMARKAFVSHVRAYATHVLKERGMFDVKALHLGHLAKAFALRDRPGSMGRGGSGSGAGTKAVRRPPRREGLAKDDDVVPVTEKQDAARKMRKAMDAHMAGASEFNIG